MSNLPEKIEPKELTPEQYARAKDVMAAEEFLNRFYPEFSERIDEQDITQLITLAHMLFKTNPEYLEVTTQMRRLPKQ